MAWFYQFYAQLLWDMAQWHLQLVLLVIISSAVLHWICNKSTQIQLTGLCELLFIDIYGKSNGNQNMSFDICTTFLLRGSLSISYFFYSTSPTTVGMLPTKVIQCLIGQILHWAQEYSEWLCYLYVRNSGCESSLHKKACFSWRRGTT